MDAVAQVLEVMSIMSWKIKRAEVVDYAGNELPFESVFTLCVLYTVAGERN